MKREKQLNGSAAEVAAAFYDALNRADLDALMALWADDEEIVCIHPGAGRLIGHAAIRASWQSLLAGGGLHIMPTQLHESHNLMSSVHTVIEASHATQGSAAHLLATNVFIKTPRGWRITLHHASVAAGGAPPETSPSMLH